METTTNSCQPAEEYKVPTRHFVLLSTARSGSTLLMDLVNNHPLVKCLHEPLNREILAEKQLTGASPETLLKYIRSCLDETENKVVGIKVFLEHFRDTGLTLADLLGVMNSPKLIALYRPDILDTFVSLQIAYATNKWYSTKERSPVAVDINYEEFREYSIAWKQLWNATASEVKELLKADDRLSFTYDELVKDKHSVTQQCFRLLGVWEMDYDIVHYSVKQNPTDLAKKVKNLEEISKCIQKEPELLTLKLQFV